MDWAFETWPCLKPDPNSKLLISIRYKPESHRQGMGRSSRSRKEASSSRRRRKSDDSDSDSDSYTDSDDSDSLDSSPARSSGKRKERSSRSRKSSSRRRNHSDDESYESDDSDRKKKRSSRNVTEEQIAEYLAKKAQKKAARVAKKLKSKTVSGYSNDSNPFGDSNLNETFVWRKKIERDVSHGVPLDVYSVKAEKQRQRDRMAEIEKVKKRREERALEKAQHEEEMALLARERARAEFQDWEKKEEEFHFDQSKMRSEIRLREGRIKPIDVLSKHLDGSDDLDIEINEPYMVFKGLTVKEMEELRDDIKMHLDLDRATPTHIEYWEALLVVCDWELSEARKKDALDRARVRGEEPPAELLAEQRGMHSSIEADVKNLLEGKTYSQLEALQSEIESQMRSGTAKVVEYWEAVLTRLHIFKAKACLKEIHAKMLHKHLQRLEGREDDEEKLDMPDDLQPEEESEPDANGAETYSPEPVEEEIHIAEEEAEEAGSFSPELLHGDENEEVMDPEEDRAILERKRMAVLEEQQRRIQEAMASKPAPPSEDNFEMKAAMKAMGAMEEGDAIFGSGSEVNLDSQVYWWHDKYRPRKPKYFNRVHTGYEWNKYNQTHYDHDNPPPKIVQGYKFNIFYPDLVDKIKAPTYTIEKDGNSSETCIIRFHAGPPYEDIAFRIVNKEWEYSHKKGFKCTFERGILHVYFNFKRYRYRR
ncbi:splicing factor Cactin [Rosa rugosa]|uniref:splicing factor Cactin n=1 Tax=Rosa rugosa TaxID=74645 RepID=UPI002B41777C|nr:splicing factor Cactin [Rosa rugosa]